MYRYGPNGQSRRGFVLSEDSRTTLSVISETEPFTNVLSVLSWGEGGPRRRFL